MGDRTDPKKKSRNLKCPAKDKLAPDAKDILLKSGMQSASYDPNDPYKLADKRIFPEKNQKESSKEQEDAKTVRRQDPGKSKENSLKETMSKVDEQKPGDFFFKFSDDPDSSHISVRDEAVVASAKGGTTGIVMKGGMVAIQGKVKTTASGTDIVKGKYTENPESYKLFTSTEVVSMESSVKEGVYEAAGNLGIDMSSTLGEGGSVPLMTTIEEGPMPHFHQMLFEHTHAVEPAYLFHPPDMELLEGILDSLKKFKGK